MAGERKIQAAASSIETIKEAGLRFVADNAVGIQRLIRPRGFVYVDPDGRAIKDAATLARIKSLAIPPAWEEVWICRFENGHIQATGRDARRRKQYRYHPGWREARDNNKYQRLSAFARVVPLIRRRIRKDLAMHGMPREKVLATIVRLLEATLIRVGNEEYARQNHSFGLTTMRNRHVTVTSEHLVFKFYGKSGKKHKISLHDRQLARTIKRCQEMPGQELFAYEDGEGNVHQIGSQDVNQYLREITGGEFTAKDFRTWAGTVLAAVALRELGAATSESQAKRNVVLAIEAVASKLGNTPAVCRKCYVHPAITDAYMAGVLITPGRDRKKSDSPDLTGEEKAVLRLLERS